uniref:Uncharacterized protein n=1 Tax=Anguilla anguilla TaxID=7936 RepID=A0A0E9TC92_ANGAN
MRQTTGHGDE